MRDAHLPAEQSTLISTGNTMNRFAACVVLLAGLASQTSVANAAQDSALFPLACQYRAAIVGFEDAVLRVRGIDRGDERLVDQLEDATAKMRLAARNPRHLNRLFHEWQDVKKLHAQVEMTIFGKYTPHHELVQRWNAARYHYALFADEFFYQVENPRHGNTVRKVQSSSARRASYLGSPTLWATDDEVAQESGPAPQR